MRQAYGLPRVTDFTQITSDGSVQAALRATYGNVNNIDAWVGGLAEQHLPGSSLGPLFSRIIANQFSRLRDGDRFWFENVFRGPQLNALEHTTLASIIRANTSLTNLQPDVFLYFSGTGPTGPQGPGPGPGPNQPPPPPPALNGLPQRPGGPAVGQSVAPTVSSQILQTGQSQQAGGSTSGDDAKRGIAWWI